MNPLDLFLCSLAYALILMKNNINSKDSFILRQEDIHRNISIIR